MADQPRRTKRMGEAARLGPDMRRRWLVPALLGGTALVTVVTAAAVLFWPRATTTPDVADATASAAPEDEGIAWVFFTQLPPDGNQGVFVLQAGMLGDVAPRIDMEVPWAVDTTIDVARSPAVARPAGGSVAFVADDGETSTVARVPIRPDAEPEVLATLDEAVWSIAAAPDGSAVYLALVERGQPETDLGVFRLALDGSGLMTPVLAPVGGEALGPVRLVAVAPFTVRIDISRDGRHLYRDACRGAAGCQQVIVALESDEVHDLGMGAGVGMVTVADLGAGGLIVVDRCGNAGCAAQLVDIESGTSFDLRSMALDSTVRSVDGRPVLVGIESGGMQTTLVATDPSTEARQTLLDAPPGDWMALADRTYPMAVPDGWVVVIQGGLDGDEMTHRYLLVPLDGGDAIEVPPPAIRPVGPPGAKG